MMTRLQRKPNFRIEGDSDVALVIRDMGPWNVFPTVTNGAEHVVDYLAIGGRLRNGKKLLYYDSDGRLDQLLHWDGEFKGFATERERPYAGPERS